MKGPILVIAALLCAAVASGTPQANRDQKHLMIATPAGNNISLAADEMERRAPNRNIIHLKGNVEIRAKDMVLHSDEATYNENTGEIEATGSVRAKLENAQ
jgi:lipopolysaccharide assembly outer membrane protein LptD (OstA)